MAACYICGGEIEFRRRKRRSSPLPRTRPDLVEEEYETYPIHLDGGCNPSPGHHVPVTHAHVIPFLEHAVGKDLCGILVNVAERSVAVAALGEVAATWRHVLSCDLRVSEHEVVRVYVASTHRPRMNSVICLLPVAVTIRNERGEQERALFAEAFSEEPFRPNERGA